MTNSVRMDISGLTLRWSQVDAARFRAEGHWQDSTLVDTARAALAAEPEATLLIEGERRLTRREAWDKALRLAAFFHRRGLKPGDVVSLQLPNWIEAAIIALAARMCGLIINPIPPIYRDAEMGYILGNCRAKMIFVPGVFRKHTHASKACVARCPICRTWWWYATKAGMPRSPPRPCLKPICRASIPLRS